MRMNTKKNKPYRTLKDALEGTLDDHLKKLLDTTTHCKQLKGRQSVLQAPVQFIYSICKTKKITYDDFLRYFKKPPRIVTQNPIHGVHFLDPERLFCEQAYKTAVTRWVSLVGYILLAQLLLNKAHTLIEKTELESKQQHKTIGEWLIKAVQEIVNVIGEQIPYDEKDFGKVTTRTTHESQTSVNYTAGLTETIMNHMGDNDQELRGIVTILHNICSCTNTSYTSTGVELQPHLHRTVMGSNPDMLDKLRNIVAHLSDICINLLASAKDKEDMREKLELKIMEELLKSIAPKTAHGKTLFPTKIIGIHVVEPVITMGYALKTINPYLLYMTHNPPSPAYNNSFARAMLCFGTILDSQCTVIEEHKSRKKSFTTCKLQMSNATGDSLSFIIHQLTIYTNGKTSDNHKKFIEKIFTDYQPMIEKVCLLLVTWLKVLTGFLSGYRYNINNQSLQTGQEQNTRLTEEQNSLNECIDQLGKMHTTGQEQNCLQRIALHLSEMYKFAQKPTLQKISTDVLFPEELIDTVMTLVKSVDTIVKSVDTIPEPQSISSTKGTPAFVISKDSQLRELFRAMITHNEEFPKNTIYIYRSDDYLRKAKQLHEKTTSSSIKSTDTTEHPPYGTQLEAKEDKKDEADKDFISRIIKTMTEISESTACLFKQTERQSSTSSITTPESYCQHVEHVRLAQELLKLAAYNICPTIMMPSPPEPINSSHEDKIANDLLQENKNATITTITTLIDQASNKIPQDIIQIARQVLLYSTVHSLAESCISSISKAAIEPIKSSEELEVPEQQILESLHHIQHQSLYILLNSRATKRLFSSDCEIYTYLCSQCEEVARSTGDTMDTESAVYGMETPHGEKRPSSDDLGPNKSKKSKKDTSPSNMFKKKMIIQWTNDQPTTVTNGAKPG